MQKIVECVPNFSEGKNKAVIKAISVAIESVPGIKLLNVDPGEDFNRTVYTFVGEPKPVLEAAFQAAKIGLALIDMTKHKGEHARMGALDVCPFIPIKGVSDKDCINLSKKFAERVSTELGIPVFLYAKSATKPNRVKLPSIRKGEYEALEEKLKDPAFKPDYGKPIFIPKSGATATGCRDILLAYNINLNTNDKKIASKIAGKIRTSGVIKKDEHGNKIIGKDGKPERIPGFFKGLQAGGMMYNENIAQVSMNLLNYREVNLHNVFEKVREEGNKLGIRATGSEIVGLVPVESMILSGKFYAKKEGLNISDEEELVSLAIEKLGLSELYPFKQEEKIIEYMIEEAGPLVSLKINDFLSELASNSPAPGGGSVAALSGGLAAALASMVCNLTIGKERYTNVQNEIKKSLKKSEKLRKKLTELIDEDTNAFQDVIKAFKMPKETEEQKKKRSTSIQNGYKKAAQIPLDTARLCAQILDVAKTIAEIGNVNSITDAAVSSIMARSAVESAILNVEINLGSIKDIQFVKNTKIELDDIRKNVSNQANEILNIVHNKM
jgi:glutamate formiminotransferase/formiminotetrahydrofolate cyclodeaminase